MKQLDRWPIKDGGDLVYAKIALKNHLHHQPAPSPDFLVFAVMELGTNLVKHSDGGEVWLLEEQGRLLLAALDRGPGIADPAVAKGRGYSTHPDSLGLGLYQLSQNEIYALDLFSLPRRGTAPHGTLALIRPVDLHCTAADLSLPLTQVSGDFVQCKGRHYLFGDAVGHGVAASRSARAAIDLFMKETISCLTADYFFARLHQRLAREQLRGVVAAIVEHLPGQLSVCGRGNLHLWEVREEQVLLHALRDGIYGDIYADPDRLDIDLEACLAVVLCTDGTERTLVNRLLPRLAARNLLLCIVAIAWFGAQPDHLDDRTVLAFRGGRMAGLE